jgi:hypothetical protein
LYRERFDLRSRQGRKWFDDCNQSKDILQTWYAAQSPIGERNCRKGSRSVQQ